MLKKIERFPVYANEGLALLKDILVRRGWLPSNLHFARFVIVSAIRTGSTMLGFYLGSHPRIRMFQEIFHQHETAIPFSTPGYAWKSRSKELLGLRKSDPERFLEEEIFVPQSPDTEAVGFRLIYGQGRVDEPFWFAKEFDHWWPTGYRPPKYGDKDSNVWRYLENRPEIFVIHLRRRNLLKQYLSGEVAKKTGHWGFGATGGYGSTAGVKVYLNPDHTVQHIEATQRMGQEVDEMLARGRLIHVLYEDIVKHKQERLDVIGNFLHVSEMAFDTQSKKQSSRTPNETIANYDEVASTLRGSQWEYMLDD